MSSNKENILGHWISVEHSMPDKGVGVVVWVGGVWRFATYTTNNTWVSGGKRVMGVTHWCSNILAPVSK